LPDRPWRSGRGARTPILSPPSRALSCPWTSRLSRGRATSPGARPAWPARRILGDGGFLSGIEIQGLTKTYRGGMVRALDDVSLSVRPGEAFGIIGPNGAGKTTLLGCLLGLLRPDTGRISVDGRPADDLAVRCLTGYLPERLVLDRWMAGIDFLAYHHALAGLDPARRRDEAAAALERVGLTPEDGRQAIRRYSRGMLQRLGLAQALLGAPRYLFLDEPISGVGPAGLMLVPRRLPPAPPH